MVLLRWTVPNTHHPRHFLLINNTLPWAHHKNGHCDAHPHLPHTTTHPPIRPTVYAYSELAHILLRMRVSELSCSGIFGVFPLHHGDYTRADINVSIHELIANI